MAWDFSASKNGDVLEKILALPALQPCFGQPKVHATPLGGRSPAGPQPPAWLGGLQPHSLHFAPFFVHCTAQLDAVQNATRCAVGGVATRVQCSLAHPWPPAPWGCPPALWGPFPVPLGTSGITTTSAAVTPEGSERFPVGFPKLLRATAWPCGADSLLGVPLLQPPAATPLPPLCSRVAAAWGSRGLQHPCAHRDPSQPSSPCLPHSSSLHAPALPGSVLGLYVVCAGCGTEPGCGLPTACPGSPVVAPAPFTSPCSRRLSWLETRAQLPEKLGGTEIVARGSCVPLSGGVWGPALPAPGKEQ